MQAVDEETQERVEARQLHFSHLPVFAKYLLEEKLEELVHDVLAIAREVNYPLLKYFAHMPEEQLLELSRVSQADFLTHVINNTLDLQIEQSMKQWKENQLPLIAKEQVVGEDITLGSYMRKRAWMKLLKGYTNDAGLVFNILSELDEFQRRADAIAFTTFINIQNERLAEINEALLANEKLYKQAQSITHIGNWSWTIATGKINWSDEMYRIYGLEPQSEEITFERFTSMIHRDDREKRVAQIQKSLETLDPPYYNMRIIRPSGEIVVLSGKNEVHTDAEGKPLRMVGTCQDITTEYHLQESIREANRSLEMKNRELERSNKELTSFNYVASHDLQEPLRKIKTYSDLISQTEGEKLSAKGQKFFENINSAANRMHQLIQDLLSYSRTHNSAVEMKPVDLNDIIHEVRAQYDEREGGAKPVFNITKLPVVTGVSFQFYQLFENIIANSVKYAGKGAVAEVMIRSKVTDGYSTGLEEANPDQPYHAITIQDRGIGFSPEFNSKIFEIFQRLHNADEYSGTGIGLAICKRIVQNHDGFIVASGMPGEGALFTVYLPVRE